MCGFRNRYRVSLRLRFKNAIASGVIVSIRRRFGLYISSLYAPTGVEDSGRLMLNCDVPILRMGGGPWRSVIGCDIGMISR